MRLTNVTYTVPTIHCHLCNHTIEMEHGVLNEVARVRSYVKKKAVEIEINDLANKGLLIGTLREIE